MHDALIAKLDAFPRLPLVAAPSPLEELPRLSRALRRPVLVKRDDQIGPALGGNKARKLEYLIGDARRRGARRVATFGGLQSNHARLTAAAARMAGIEAHLIYLERRPARLTGNLLLAEQLGARLHFIPLGAGGGLPIERANALVGLLARALVGRHAFIPVGGHSWLGCLGYARCALELDAQLRALGLRDATLVCAAGTGGTLAGLAAGLALAGAPARALGVDIGRLWQGFHGSTARVADAICARLGAPGLPAPFELIEGRFVGDGYARPSARAQAAMARLAQLEGLLLDPIYTGKAFAGMLELAEGGELGRATPLIFLHTGGAPGIFA